MAKTSSKKDARYFWSEYKFSSITGGKFQAEKSEYYILLI